MESKIIEAAKENVKYWWVSLLVGILAIAVGIMSSVEPVVTIGILTVFFIAYFLVSGIMEIIFSVANRKDLKDWGWMLAGGILNLVFACLLLAIPVGSMIVFIYYVSFYILLQSLMGIGGAFSLKDYKVEDWWVFLIIAILGVILAFILITQPVFAASFITVIFAVGMICYGLFRVFYAFRLKKLKKEFDK